jgi:GntR family transcriptional regulator, transcriptional repressor for pyruvate dehydrogenase complex
MKELQATFRPLKKRRFSDQIADVIQEKILKERLQTGTSLPTEQELAGEFQVSRSVVREALRILEISGLVKVKKGSAGGVFVSDGIWAPIRKSLRNMVARGDVTVAHLFDVRFLIEPQMAKEAALHIAEKDIAVLEELFRDSCAHLGDPVHLKKNNLNFHLLLARASGNPVFSVLLESVFELLIEISLDFFDSSAEKGFHENHEKIFQMIQRRKAGEVERLMKEDIRDTKEKLTRFKQRMSKKREEKVFAL